MSFRSRVRPVAGPALSRAAIPLLALALALASGAAGASAATKPRVDRFIGLSRDWTAMQTRYHGHRLCYAYTTAKGHRGVRHHATLFVSKPDIYRPSAGLATGHAFAAGTRIMVAAGRTRRRFVPQGHVAFARGSAGAIRTFERQASATATVATPEGHATYRFSLLGFSAVLRQIERVCAG